LLVYHERHDVIRYKGHHSASKNPWLSQRGTNSTKESSAKITHTLKIILVHGFTQNAESMSPFANELEIALKAVPMSAPLSNSHEEDPVASLTPQLEPLHITASTSTPSLALYRFSPSIYGIDLPGHGMSSSIETGPWETARLLGEAFGRGIYIGYSMGARICLHLALSYPELVEALVLISASAGIKNDNVRQARKSSDDEMAKALDEGRPDLATFLERWTEQPLFSTLPDHAKMTEQRMANTPSGLASSLRLCGAGVCDPLWNQLGALKMPVHCFAGTLDSRYTYYALRMARLIGANATVSLIPSTGHACYMERPKLVSSLISNLI